MLRTLLLALSISAPAGDSTVLTISGGDPTLTFVIPSQPTAEVTLNGEQLGYEDVAATYDGQAIIIPFVIFSPTALGGGVFTVPVPYHPFSYNADQFYSGLETAPVFTSASYDLTNNATGKDDHITISTSEAGVPEPSTWLFLALGFGFARLSLRRRKVIAPKIQR